MLQTLWCVISLCHINHKHYEQEREFYFVFSIFSLKAFQSEPKHFFKIFFSNTPRPEDTEKKVFSLILIHSAVHVVFHTALSISDISPLWFPALGKWKKRIQQPPLLAISGLSVRYAAPWSILASAEILTGLLWIVTTAKVGLDSGRFRKGVSKRSILSKINVG